MHDDIRLGDIVKMRKGHPCGSNEWDVVRLGADIGIRCRGCGRRVLLPRSRFLRQMKALIGHTPEANDAPPGESAAV